MRATRQTALSGNIRRSSRKTDWSVVAEKKNGKHGCRILPRRRRNCSVVNNNALANYRRKNKRKLTLSAPICGWSGRHRPPAIVIARSFYAPCWKKSFSKSRKESHADLTLRWRGGMTTKLDLALKRYQAQGPTTDEDTMSLLRRLAAHYPDNTIAGILNRQARKTAYGERFTAQQVGSLRRYHEIPRFQPSRESPQGEVVPVMQAAKILDVATSTFHRWLNAGLIAGEQLTPGAPWAHSDYGRITPGLRGHRTARLCARRGRHEATRHLTANVVAACKAWPTRSSPCSKGTA